MRRYADTILAGFCSVLLLAGVAVAKQPVVPPQEWTPDDTEVDRVGDLEGAVSVSKALEDTIWIADWSFDGPSGCTSDGWTTQDARVLNDGSNYWQVTDRYAGFKYGTNAVIITGKSAWLGKHDLCWDNHDGYGNDWDYSIVCRYKGRSRLSFRYLVDSKPGDSLRVEADSAWASNDRVDYVLAPSKGPASYRMLVGGFEKSGLIVRPDTLPGTQRNTWADLLELPDFGVPSTVHCVYIRFVSNAISSAEDCGDACNPPTLGVACVIDSIVVQQEVVTDPAYNYTEMFEGAINPNIALVNSANAKPFGNWARLYQHITDNDRCTENMTCAWLFTDPATIANDPSMAFGPGSAVVRNWLDNRISSPWVSLASTPSALGTVVSFRRFPGNDMAKSKILMNWSVRGRTRIDNTDTPAPGDSIDCPLPWGHSSSWNSLGTFRWITSAYDMSSNFSSSSRDIQVRFRVSDWQLVTGDGPPTPFMPGPGPYLDRVRIGRRFLRGPVLSEVIDARYQGQDCFATVPNAIPGFAPGHPHVDPGTDRFGTCAFSLGADIGSRASPNLVTGDSIHIQVRDVRNAGGIASISWCGAITDGPHAGKAPPPYSVGGNGFFSVIPDSVRQGSELLPYYYFVTLDDDYFRGGDALVYFGAATDAAGGFASDPDGLTGMPASVAAAEAATGGLLEVNFLPAINWDAGYLARIAASPDGKLEPTAQERASSFQRSCILYYNQGVNSRRRSGDLNRTSFMYTLDNLGYRGWYDVYDCQGYGNTNNQLGGRCSQAEATGYALIVHDNGRSSYTTMSDGAYPWDTNKIRQAQWYRDWLALASTSEIGTHTLWLIGENTIQEKPTLALYNIDMGVGRATNAITIAVNPDVRGQVGTFTWANGNVSNFATAEDPFSLNGGCPSMRGYDGLNALGTAVVTHRYAACTTLAEGAIVMKANAVGKWNTIFQSFGWFDIRDPRSPSCVVPPPPPGPPPANPPAGNLLASKILSGVLADHNQAGPCGHQPNPVGSAPEDGLPRVTALHQNVPNPFNPVTTIRFDLAHPGPVGLRVFDVAGHLVRVLASDARAAGRYAVTWDGQDARGRHVASGVYFYRLATEDLTMTKKMVILK